MRIAEPRAKWAIGAGWARIIQAIPIMGFSKILARSSVCLTQIATDLNIMYCLGTLIVDARQDAQSFL